MSRMDQLNHRSEKKERVALKGKVETRNYCNPYPLPRHCIYYLGRILFGKSDKTSIYMLNSVMINILYSD